MEIQNKNTNNNIKSKNNPKSKTLRELEKLALIDWYIVKAKCTIQWEEEHIRKVVCKLNPNYPPQITLKLSLVRLN